MLFWFGFLLLLKKQNKTKNTIAKNKLEKERIYFILQLLSYNPSLRKVSAGTPRICIVEAHLPRDGLTHSG